MIGPSKLLHIASLLSSPEARRTIILDSMIVPIPIVKQNLGTSFLSINKRELASMVSWVKVLTLVRDVREELGSLNPM